MQPPYDAIIHNPERRGWCKTHQCAVDFNQPGEGKLCDYCAVGACATPCEIYSFKQLFDAIQGTDTMRRIKAIEEWSGKRKA